MKKFLYMIAAMALAMQTIACGDLETDDVRQESKLVLTIDKNLVQAASDDYVTVTVSDTSGVITEGLIFLDKNTNKRLTIENGRFYPPTAGEYTFLASDGFSFSDYVTVQAIDFPVPPLPVENEADKDKSAFKKRTMIVQFTSVACVACPTMKVVLNQMADDPSYADRYVLASSHHDMNEVEDPASYHQGEAFQTKLGVSSYPKLIVDYVNSFELYTGQAVSEAVASLKGLVDRLNANDVTPAGIAVNSVGSQSAVVARVNIKVGAQTDGRWYVGAFLLQDGIEARQAPTNDMVVHDNCIRDIDGGTGYYGQSLGRIQLGDTADYTFVFTGFEPNVVVDNCKLLVYVTYDNVVQNARVVPVGDSAGFEYASVD